MSAPISSTGGTAPAPAAAVQPSASDATTAGAVMSSNASQEVTSSTKLGSMEDLKRKAPKVYRFMMEGIAMNICNEMQHHQDRLKQMWREADRR